MSDITNVKITALHVNQSVNFECDNLNITQQFKPNWATERAYGKMDPIANYSGTDRTAQFKMLLLANQLLVSQQMQSKVAKFIQFSYPAYEGSGTPFLKAPPFVQISCLQNKLYTELKGYITDLTITPGSEGQTVPLIDATGRFFERRYDINFTLQVLHSNIVGYLGGSFSGGGSGFVFYGDSGGVPASDTKSKAATKTEDVTTNPNHPAGKNWLEEMSGVNADKAVPAPAAAVATAMGASGEDSVESLKNFTAPPVNQTLDKTDPKHPAGKNWMEE